MTELIDTMHCRISPLSYVSNNKQFCFKLGAYSFA